MSTTQTHIRPGLKHEHIWLAAVLAVAIATYLPTFRYLWASWKADVQYSLAWLVPLVCGYFVWKKWPEVRRLERSPSSWGLVLIAFGLLMHLAGTILDVSGPSSVSLIVCIVGGCLAFHGSALVKTLAFPLAYTVFMIPVPGGLITKLGLPMQLWASGTTAVLLRAMGLAVTRNGVNLTVEDNAFEVAQACSGMSSLVALVGVTAVFAYVTRLPAGYKWLLFFLALPIALIANVVRVTTIALVGYQWGQEAAMNVYHDWSSPILFLAAVALLFLISGGLEWLSKRRTTSSS